jgi:hypothetical protein
LPNGAVTSNASLTISGTVTDPSGIMSLTINGNPVTVASNGTFSYVLTLVSGSNTITTIVTDNLNRQTSDTRTITLNSSVAPVPALNPISLIATTMALCVILLRRKKI